MQARPQLTVSHPQPALTSVQLLGQDAVLLKRVDQPGGELLRGFGHHTRLSIRLAVESRKAHNVIICARSDRPR